MKRVLLLVTLMAVPALAANDFDSLVRDMEHRYGMRKTYIPFLGFANFMVKVARPAGARDFKLAVFEHVDSDRHPSLQDLDETYRFQGWKPFVRVVSNRKQDRVQIYARESGRDHELLITTFERNQTVMVRVRVNPEGLAKWVNNPRLMCGQASKGL